MRCRSSGVVPVEIMPPFAARASHRGFRCVVGVILSAVCGATSGYGASHSARCRWDDSRRLRRASGQGAGHPTRCWSDTSPSVRGAGFWPGRGSGKAFGMVSVGDDSAIRSVRYLDKVKIIRQRFRRGAGVTAAVRGASHAAHGEDQVRLPARCRSVYRLHSFSVCFVRNAGGVPYRYCHTGLESPDMF